MRPNSPGVRQDRRRLHGSHAAGVQPAGPAPGCQTGQECVFDANCEPVCQEECTLPCPTGQECYFATPTAQACRATATFDAGYLIFSGTTTPITLYPPYTFDATESQGSLFSPGQPISVTAAGATGAGFAPFTESCTGNSRLQTTPSLALLSGAEVFGSAGFSVGWQPGTDAVTIGISGPGGAATCAATDSSGTFSIPAAVVTAVAQAPSISGPLPTYGTATVTVSVTRQRLQETTNAKTVGSLPNATVQSVGYLDLSTYSSESVSVTGTITPECPAGDTLCSDGCQEPPRVHDRLRSLRQSLRRHHVLQQRRMRGRRGLSHGILTLLRRLPEHFGLGHRLRRMRHRVRHGHVLQRR